MGWPSRRALPIIHPLGIKGPPGLRVTDLLLPATPAPSPGGLWDSVSPIFLWEPGEIGPCPLMTHDTGSSFWKTVIRHSQASLQTKQNHFELVVLRLFLSKGRQGPHRGRPKQVPRAP